jgi:hypothetical protein
MRPSNQWVAGLLGVGLLAAFPHAALAQFDWWCDNGHLCTHSVILHGGAVWCEPETSPQCPVARQEPEPTPPQEEEQAPRPQGLQRAAPAHQDRQTVPAQQERQPAPPPQEKPRQAAAPHLFNPRTLHQIQPLNCPRGFASTGRRTFYGGTMCVPVRRGSVTAGGQPGPSRPGRKLANDGAPVGNHGAPQTVAPIDRSGNRVADLERLRPNRQGSTAGSVYLPWLNAAEQLPWDWTGPVPLLREQPAEGFRIAEGTHPAQAVGPTPAPTDKSQITEADRQRAISNMRDIDIREPGLDELSATPRQQKNVLTKWKIGFVVTGILLAGGTALSALASCGLITLWL